MSNLLSSVTKYHLALIVVCLWLAPGTQRGAAFAQFVDGSSGGSESNSSGDNADDPNTEDPNANDPNNVRVINGNTAGIAIDARAMVRRALGQTNNDLAELRRDVFGRIPGRRSSRHIVQSSSGPRTDLPTERLKARGKTPTRAGSFPTQVKGAKSGTERKVVSLDWRPVRTLTDRRLDGGWQGPQDSQAVLPSSSATGAHRKGLRDDSFWHRKWWWD